MKALLTAFIFLVSCGGNNTTIIFSDASADSVVDSVVDTQTIDVYFDNCYEEIINVAREAERCSTDLKAFWKYMEYIESLSCDNIRSGNFKKLC